MPTDEPRSVSFVDPPRTIPWLLRPALWLAKRMTGKEPLPARLLAHHPKSAIAGGVLELLAAHGPRDLERRTLRLARLAASVTTGCPFCVDMNSAGFAGEGLTRAELDVLLTGGDPEDAPTLSRRERTAVAYARALSRTPVVIESALARAVKESFDARETVVLTTAVAQVNYWARLNQGLGVPAAGFFEGCAQGESPARQ